MAAPLRKPTALALRLLAGLLVCGGLIGSALWWHLKGAPKSFAQHALMPLTFAHSDHGAFNCVICHHNYTEPKLASWPFQHCIECHKKTPEITPFIEEQFHHQCESCHLRLKQEKRATGPVRACHICHTREPIPRF
ncbi:cytochrome c3 family protein [Acetobacter conturbans]